jgi:hypothetical protein
MSQIWIETLKIMPGVITAITAVVGVTIAARGLNKWRSESVGKRRMELAEDVLADFYQARDIINAARSSGIFGNEGATRERETWESESDTRTLNAYFATVERLNNKADFFAQLHARRYRFIALFGKDAAEPYNDLHKVYVEVVVAAQMLLSTYRNRMEGTLPQSYKKWRETIWQDLANDDPIPPRLDRIMEAIEATCRPVIQETAKTNS